MIYKVGCLCCLLIVELYVKSGVCSVSGEHIGAAWQDDNKRISGNRVLYQGHRKEAQENFVLG